MAQPKLTSDQIDIGTAEGQIPVLDSNGNIPLGTVPNEVYSDWMVFTSNHTATSGEKILADTSGGVWVLTLPLSPVVGNVVDVADHAGTFATNNLTINRNGEKIMGLSQDMTVDVNNASFSLVFSGLTYGWRIV